MTRKDRFVSLSTGGRGYCGGIFTLKQGEDTYGTRHIENVVCKQACCMFYTVTTERSPVYGGDEEARGFPHSLSTVYSPSNTSSSANRDEVLAVCEGYHNVRVYRMSRRLEENVGGCDGGEDD
jgi:hypothetical protein